MTEANEEFLIVSRDLLVRAMQPVWGQTSPLVDVVISEDKGNFNLTYKNKNGQTTPLPWCDAKAGLTAALGTDSMRLLRIIQPSTNSLDESADTPQRRTEAFFDVGIPRPALDALKASLVASTPA